VERPRGVTAIAALFMVAGVYLATIGLVMLIRPGLVSMAAGADLLGGLEVAGPYMFLLMGAVAGSIGIGLLRLSNWARRIAAVAALAGLVLLVPAVSSSVVDFRIQTLAWGGLGIIVRVVIVWYLYQLPVREAFGN
jgi:hypothetical protein